MPYKISGTKTETARVIVLKESDWSIESNTVVSGSGVYSIEDLETGSKLAFSRATDGEIIGYGAVNGIYYTIPAFRFEVKTTGADTFKLPIYDGGTYDFHVVWGDGGEDDITVWNDAAANHSYSGAGTWNVEITGTITGWRFANIGDKLLIYDISEWGPLNVGSLHSAFSGCTNLTVSATDILDLTGTTTMLNMFRGTSLTTVPSMNDWDVSSIINMSGVFQLSTNFNQDISSWNVGSVTNMNYMFYDTSFNQNISSWNVGSVIDMSYMFYLNTNFNQAIGSWGTGSVTNMTGMFQQATGFDQNVGSLDISLVTAMGNMFNTVTLSTANYDALLIGWEAQDEKPNVTFHGGNSTYTDPGPAKTARDALEANGWNITDGGPA